MFKTVQKTLSFGMSAKKKTNLIWEANRKLRFKSRYTDLNKQITAAQYLAELMCERKAGYDKSSLFMHFWHDSAHVEHFQNQVRAANRLLRSYPIDIILRCLRQTPKIYSLLNKEFRALLRKLGKPIVDKIKKGKLEKPLLREIPDIETMPKKPFTQNNLFNKLEE